MSKNVIKNLIIILALVLISVVFVIVPNIFANNGREFDLNEIMATASGTKSISNYNTIIKRSVSNLLGYVVKENGYYTGRNIAHQSEYAFCVGGHNEAPNDRWYITKVLDITSLDNATYSDVNGNKIQGNGEIYSKLAIYAYMQNVYKIEDYGKYRNAGERYVNSLYYLLPQVPNCFTEVSRVNDPYYDSPGISKDLLTLENNYANFVNKLKAVNNKIFADDKTKELQNSNNGNYGPINIKLSSGLAATYTDVHKTYTNEYVGQFSTGVRVNLTVKYSDGSKEQITNSSAAYIKDTRGNKINPLTFDWRSNFYIQVPTGKSLEKVIVNYEYDLYKARYLYLSCSLPDGTYTSQDNGVFGGDKETIPGSFEIPIDRGVNVYLQKVDSNDSSKKLSGVVFKVFNGNTQICELITGQDGKTTKSITLAEGTYTVKEIRNNNYGYKEAAYEGKITITKEQVDSKKDIVIDIKNTQNLKPLVIQKEGESSNVQSGVKFIISIKNGDKVKYLRIIDNNNKKVNNLSKVDISKTGLATSLNYGVQYVENASDSTIFVTGDDGKITINNLEVFADSNTKYKYIAIEQSNPNYGYKGKTNAGRRVENSDLSKNSEIKITNKMELGNLKIEKVDGRDKSIKLSGVDFKISNELGFIAVEDKKGEIIDKIVGATRISRKGITYNEDNKTYYKMRYVNEDQATIFTTGTNGVLGINNLEVYKDNANNKFNYVIKEIATNNPYYQITEATVKATIERDITSTVEVTNKQVFVDISGYVWEDCNRNVKDQSESAQFDNLYEKKSNISTDELMEGITVRLVEKSTKNTVKNADGIECITKTDSDGEYKFKKLSVDKLENYYVEFTYDGLKYTSVVLNKDKDNGSKAQEVESSRTEFNNKYSEITPTFSNTNVNVIATTDAAGYTIAQNSSEIKNINLGLRLREETDIAIADTTDIQNVEVSLNNYTHIYEYGLREKNNVSVDALNTEVDVQNIYTRQMYESDIKACENNSNKLKVYVIYKIIVQNETQTLAIAPREIVNYLDKDSEVVDSWLEDGTKISWSNSSKYGKEYFGNEYKAIYTSSLQNIRLNPNGQEGSAKVIYLKVQVSDNKVLGLLNQDAIVSNVSEINGYTTYYTEKTREAGIVGNRAGQVYGSLDKDSQPGNAIPGDKSTYQDDTKATPTLKLTVKAARGLAGIVWEDENIKDSGERLGNGILDSNENKIKNVKVELLDADTLEIAKLYTADGESDAVTYTDENGNYQFLGVIPGKYITRFTYGTMNNENGETITTTINGKEVNVRDYKSTIITSDVVKSALNGNGDMNWYLKVEDNRYSDATDDLSDETGRGSIEASRYGTLNDKYNLSADTAKYVVGVEYKTTESTVVDALGNPVGSKFVQIQNDLDLGLIERPYVNIEVKKEISYVKVILQDGSILLEGDPRSKDVKISYVKTGLNGMVPVEIDTELLHGAKLEVTYSITLTNNSEIDYDYKTDNGSYYKFGIVSNNSKEVQTFVTKLADYLDNNVVVNFEQSTDWKEVKLSDLCDITDNKYNTNNNNYISEDVYNELKTNKYILLETSKFNNLTRGKSEAVELKVSKLLAGTDDIAINNYTEILELGGQVARTVSNATPGNYVPTTSPKEIDEDTVKLTIAPPTGGIEETTRNNIVLVISIISGLMILVVGVIIIKKFIIKKK